MVVRNFLVQSQSLYLVCRQLLISTVSSYMIFLSLSGAGALFRSSYETSHIRKTIHKDQVSQKTIDAFKDTRIWKAEMEFYEFARSHFDVIKNELNENGAAGKRIYHYEKIRPGKP